MMNAKIFVLAALLAFVAAVDITAPVDDYQGQEGVNNPFQFWVTNTAGTSLTQVAYTVASDDSSVSISYPSSATKSTIGTLTASSSGANYFYLIGAEGNYNLIVTVTYKKGIYSYSQNFSATLLVIDTARKREETNETPVVELFPNFPTDETITNNPLTARGADISLTPTSYQSMVSVTTWFPFVISASVNVRAVTWAVFPSDGSVYINYPASNYIATINAGRSASTNFAATGTISGNYFLNIVAEYKKGIPNTVYYEYLNAPLLVV